MIRLLELEEEILNYMISGKLSMGHARALIGVPNAKEMANEIINKNLSVRQTEKNTANYKKNKRRQKNKDPNILDLEKSLVDKTGINVEIKNNKNNSGRLSFEYRNLEQLDRLINIIKNNY